MRPSLPIHLIQSILLLSVASYASDVPASAETATTSNLNTPSESTSTSSGILGISTRPVTLWDIGFSLNDKWADLRFEEECPVPPDLVVVDPDAKVGDQGALESAVSSLESNANVTIPTPDVPIATEVIEEGVKPSEGEEEFVSFEDWKRIKLAEEDVEIDEESSTTSDSVGVEETHKALNDSHSDDSQTKGNNISSKDIPSTPHVKNESNSSSPSVEPVPSTKQPIQSPPHNRYNYASPDCSARIHSSSPQTQHASSLLHKSKDRYMLTPCKAGEHWVVVELCDEIRVEAVEVAVWEFFSGVVREVRVSVGGAEDEDEEDESSLLDVDGDAPKNRSGWKEVGAFVGKNVRGVQTFTLPSPTSFHRFLRLDFPSYYGTEYYCPISQLKVYGMNQMEAFKWEQKRLAASAKGREKDKDRENDERRAREVKERESREKRETAGREREKVERERELGELERLVLLQASRTAGDVAEMMTEAGVLQSAADLQVTVSAYRTSTSTSESSKSKTSASPTNSAPTTATSENVTTPHVDTYTAASQSSLSSSTTSASSAPSPSTYSRSPPPKSDSSESIYAFIIRRLTALEGNSTLVARYIEEQTRVMRGMLGRVEKGWDEWRAEWEGEDRGRWETERMRQEDRLGRVISQMEHNRLSMEQDRRALHAQLRLLTDELGYERRRGLAQLFILLVIIILGVVTRGNTIDALIKPLLAEARKRRNRKSLSGPLAGLEIDMGKGKPVSVIGRRRLSSSDGRRSPPAPHRSGLVFEVGGEYERENMTTPTPRIRPSSRGATRRPSTPTSGYTSHVHQNSLRRRIPSAHVPSRSTMTSPTVETLSQVSGPGSSVLSLIGNSIPSSLLAAGGAISPRPRNSLPPLPIRVSSGMGIPPRKLGRNAHLHSIDNQPRRGPRVSSSLPDRGHDTLMPTFTSSLSPVISVNGHTPLMGGSRSPAGRFESPEGVSPRTDAVNPGRREVFPDQAVLGLEEGEWAETEDEGEASVGEVEDDLPSRKRHGAEKLSLDAVRNRVREEDKSEAWNGAEKFLEAGRMNDLSEELKEIWNSPKVS